MSTTSNAKDFKVAFADSTYLDSRDAQHDLEGRGAPSGARQGRSSGKTIAGQPTGPRNFDRTITIVEEDIKNKGGSGYSPSKLGTIQGVYVPTTLNVLSILMFVRFSFIIGQAGILGTLGLLMLSLTINLLTTLSISAISTNGTVRGGGAYYMISRSLGPEFGGSIGIVFYVGQVLNSGMNVVAFFDVLLQNFGKNSGSGNSAVIPQGFGYEFLYSVLLTLICTIVCAIGSSAFSKAGNVLFLILLIAIFSIPLSLGFVQPFFDTFHEAWYTGPRWTTFANNWLPNFTSGAAGSDRKDVETFQDMFSIFFPAMAGIFAGAGMSGDLRAPSKSIPLGTLWSLLSTFVLYLMVILSVGCSASRELIYKDIQVVQNVNLSGLVVMIGELSTCLYSVLVGIIGSAKLLQAISRDNLLPFLGLFGHGAGDSDNPLMALGFTFSLTTVTLLLDLNQIATFITMAFLMTFVATNVACFLLKISSAPNFRPSFKYFSHWTAGMGALASLISMFIADGPSASGMIILLTFLFLVIHYTSPPKPWGDVSQSLIYHQVRKYLLRLRQDHVKYWRPQILLLVDEPKRSWNLIHFCNHLKKGGLYILGHVVITDDFHNSYPEVVKQQDAWAKLRDMGHVKGFVQIAASSDVVWGARNVYLGSGLGGMKPNITVIGFLSSSPGELEINNQMSSLTVDRLPTDDCRQEPHIRVTEWVNIIEDLITMHANIAVAKGFTKLQFPNPDGDKTADTSDGYIDLYPIQMSAQITNEPSSGKTVLTTNFDTYTLILQLGAILRTVSAWKQSHRLRVIAFVESKNQANKEHDRISSLLDKLRIKAEVKVLTLTQFDSYNIVVCGQKDSTGIIESQLHNDSWWQKLKEARHRWTDSNIPEEVVADLTSQTDSTEISSRDWDAVMDRRQMWFANLHKLGVNMNIQTNRLTSSDMARVKRMSEYAPTPASSRSPSLEPSRVPSRTGFSIDTDSTPLLPKPAIGQDEESPASYQSFNTNSTQSLVDESSILTFNDVPANVQHIILNDLMKTTSRNAAVIFTTLPEPAAGTHKSPKDSQEYVQSLETWCKDLPPVMLVHSQSMTVTTSL